MARARCRGAAVWAGAGRAICRRGIMAVADAHAVDAIARTSSSGGRRSAGSATASPDRVSMGSVPSLVPGSSAAIAVAVRDEEFAPVGDASVRLRVTRPDGSMQEVDCGLDGPCNGSLFR